MNHDVDEAQAFERLVQEVIFSNNERAGIICGAAMLDQQLELILRRYLLPAASKSEDEKVFGANAPLSSFSGRITMAFRLGLIPQVVANMLNRIRKIRNDFAHDVTVQSLNESDVYKSHIAELSQVHHGAENAMLVKLQLDDNPANRLRAILIAVASMLSSTSKLVTTVEPLGNRFTVDDLMQSD